MKKKQYFCSMKEKGGRMVPFFVAKHKKAENKEQQATKRFTVRKTKTK